MHAHLHRRNVGESATPRPSVTRTRITLALASILVVASMCRAAVQRQVAGPRERSTPRARREKPSIGFVAPYAK